jgi:hypothetical protein
MARLGISLLCIAGGLLSIAASSGAAAPAEQSPSPAAATASSSGKAPLDTVTVEASRERKELEREVNQFVFAVAVRYLHDSLSRWNTPICPLVAGLPREQGEFVLGRVSQIASSAKAPLAGEHCKGNFYLIVTPEPETLIRQWQRRDPRMFNGRDGMGYLRNFRDVPRAVRVWYNTGFVSSEGRPIVSSDDLAGALVGSGLGMSLQMANVPTNKINMGSRLTYSAVRSLSSVVVIVDARRVQALSFDQLADYIGMVGLAEVNQDAEVGTVPTILRLFRAPPDPPQRLSAWDEAFLASLYAVDQASVVEQPMMKRQMVSSLVLAPRH